MYLLLTVGAGVTFQPAPLCASRVCFASAMGLERVFRFPQSSNSFKRIHSTCSREPAWTYTTFPRRFNSCVCVYTHVLPDRRVRCVRRSSLSGDSAAYGFLLERALVCPSDYKFAVCVPRCASVDSVQLFVRALAFRNGSACDHKQQGHGIEEDLAPVSNSNKTG